MLGTKIVSIPMVVILASSNWIILTLACCLWVLTTITFDIIGGVVLTQDQCCSNLWLPIGILCGAKCGCEYPSGPLLLVWIDGWICWLCGPNRFPTSMPLNLLWTTRIPSSYGWSINVPTTFCNSTCVAIHVLMWKGTKG